MKKSILVALSFVALLFGAARSARALDIVRFDNATPVKVAQVSEKGNREPGTENQEQEGEQVRGVRQSNSGAIDFTLTPRKTEQPTSNAKPASNNITKIAAFPRKTADHPPIEAVPNRGSQANFSVDPAARSTLFLKMFRGGSESLVAKAVGSAEGTRTPDGGKTWAYYGHVDPGNGKWNMGSFSYQHEASSPEDADERQLARLQRQFDAIAQIASSNGLRLNLEEKLNAIDLANQAPLAALDQGGYVERLRQAYAEGYRGADAVLRARTFSFINPQTNRWDAPGLGNTESSISRDQLRRQIAISEAIQLHQRSGSVEVDDDAAPLKPKAESAAAAARDPSLRALAK